MLSWESSGATNVEDDLNLRAPPQNEQQTPLKMGFFIPQRRKFQSFPATNFQGKGEDEASGQMVIFHQPRFLLK